MSEDQNNSRGSRASLNEPCLVVLSCVAQNPRPSIILPTPIPPLRAKTMSSHSNLHSKDSRFLVDSTTPKEFSSSHSGSVVDLPQRPLQAYLHGYPPTRSMNTTTDNGLQNAGAVANFPTRQFSVSNAVAYHTLAYCSPLF